MPPTATALAAGTRLTVAGVVLDYAYTGRVSAAEDGSTTAVTRMRSQPALDSDRAAFLANGDEVELLQRGADAWYQVRWACVGYTPGYGPHSHWM